MVIIPRLPSMDICVCVSLRICKRNLKPSPPTVVFHTLLLTHTLVNSLSFIQYLYHIQIFPMPEHDNNAPSQATMTTLEKQETNERLVGEYVLLSKIGQGSFATVYKAQHKASLRPHS